MDSYEYEQAALKNLEQANPPSLLVALTYAQLATAAEMREIQAVLARCADPAAREGL